MPHHALARRTLFVFPLLFLVFDAGVCSAQIVTSDNVTDWNNVLISGSNTSITLADGLRIGNSSSGTLVVEGLTLENTGSGNRGTYLGYESSSEGTATISGAGSLLSSVNSLIVGRQGIGTLNVVSGGKVESALAGGAHFASVGSSASGVSGTGVVKVSGMDSEWKSSSIRVGDGGTGTVNIEQGGKIVVSSLGEIGRSGGTGTVNVVGNQSRWELTGLRVGSFQGTGTLDVRDGGTVTSATGYIGYVGNLGTTTVTGDDSNWSLTGELYVGWSSTGVLNIESGGKVTAGNTRIGESSNLPASGTVNVNGASPTGVASLLKVGSLQVGYSRAGVMNVESGGRVMSSDATIGSLSNIGDGDVEVSGAGSEWKIDGNLVVGHHGTAVLNVLDGGVVSSEIGRIAAGAGTGTATVSGAGSQWINSGNLFVGQAGTGVLNIQSGGVVSNTDGYVGYDSTSSSSVTVDGAGSQWNNSGDLFVGDEGNGVLNILSGGVVSNTDGHVGYDSTRSARYDAKIRPAIPRSSS